MMSIEHGVTPRKSTAKAAQAVISWPAQIFWALTLAFGLYQLSPARWWLDVRTISVQPVWESSMSRSPSVTIDADVGLALSARVDVDIELKAGSTWRRVCGWSTGANYEPGRDQKTLDLDALTGGLCEAINLQPGTYRVNAVWRWAGPWLYVGRQALTSNLFVIE